MGWSIYELPSAQYDYDVNPIVLIISWFVGVILGTIIASLLVGRVTKNISHVSFFVLNKFYGYIIVVFATICDDLELGLADVRCLDCTVFFL